jgi:hypothetical protein
LLMTALHFLASLFLLAEAAFEQAASANPEDSLEIFAWFRDALGNSLTFALALGAAAGLSLGFLLRAWIRQTGGVFVGLFTGVTAVIVCGLLLKPVFRVDHSWMILLPLVSLMVFRAAISALSLKTPKEGFGSYFALTTAAVALAELSLLQALLFHEDRMPIARYERLGFTLVGLLLFAVSYFQPLHLTLYLSRYRQARKSPEPFNIFHDSIVDWGPWIESLNLSLPHLGDWLFRLLMTDRQQGMAAVLLVADRYPSQLQAVEEAMRRIIPEDLKRMETLDKIGRANETLEYIPADINCLSEDLMEVLGRVSNIAYSVQDYRYAETTAERLDVLRKLQEKIAAFRDQMAAASPPLSAGFQPVAARWLEIAKTAEAIGRLQKERVGKSEWKT